MKRIIVYMVIITMGFSTSCFFGVPCIEGAGDMIEETRFIDDFYNVANTTSFDVYVTQSDTFSVVVNARENLMPVIETERVGGTLVIKTREFSCIRNSNDIEVFVTLPEIEELSLAGSGIMECGDIAGDFVEINVSGSGRIKLDSLFCKDLELKLSGSGEVELELIDAETLDVRLSSSGDIDFGAAYLDELDIQVSGSGNVLGDVYGARFTEVALSSSGRIILYGDSRDIETVNSGSGKIDALDLLTSDAKTRSSGSGDTYVNVSRLLDVTILGSGNVYYLGEPEDIVYRITGSGDVKPY